MKLIYFVKMTGDFKYPRSFKSIFCFKEKNQILLSVASGITVAVIISVAVSVVPSGAPTVVVSVMVVPSGASAVIVSIVMMSVIASAVIISVTVSIVPHAASAVIMARVMTCESKSGVQTESCTASAVIMSVVMMPVIASTVIVSVKCTIMSVVAAPAAFLSICSCYAACKHCRESITS